MHNEIASRNQALNKTIRILIVEDDATTAQIAEALCANLGYTVYSASNGVEALRIYENHVLDLIFMDLQMPYMGGFEVAYEIREIEAGQQGRSVPIVAVTGTGDELTHRRALQAGMDGCVQKPYTIAMVQQLVAEFAGYVSPGGEVAMDAAGFAGEARI